MLKAIISRMKMFKNEEKVSTAQVVCGCFNITDHDLKKAIANGAGTFEEVQAMTNVSTGCNNCSDGVKALVENLLLEKKIDENQVVCGCFNQTVKDLMKAIKNGARSFEEVQARTKIGTGCGNCAQNNKILVEQLLAR